MSNPNIVITCGACQHQNEPERVYCHNCGQKLDRSLVPAATQAVAAANEAESNRKRVQKMMSLNRGKTFRDVMTGVKILIFAALLAACIQFFRKPEDVAAKVDSIPDRMLGDAWPALVAHPGGNTVQFNDTDVNYFLSKAIKTKDGLLPGTKFSRAYVKLYPGAIKVAVERDMWGLKMYSSMTFVPVQKDGGVTFNAIGVHFGRLAIHPALKSLGALSLGAVRDAFEKELKGTSRLADVQVAEGLITFTTKPAQ